MLLYFIFNGQISVLEHDPILWVSDIYDIGVLQGQILGEVIILYFNPLYQKLYCFFNIKGVESLSVNIIMFVT